MDALAALGRALHTIQDFYAHSNYVELFVDANTMHKEVPVAEELGGSLTVADVRVKPSDIKPYTGSGAEAFGKPLKSGIYGRLPDPSRGEEHHDAMMKDNPGIRSSFAFGLYKTPASVRGGTRVGNGFRYFDYAFEGARQHSLLLVEEFKRQIAKNPALGNDFRQFGFRLFQGDWTGTEVVGPDN